MWLNGQNILNLDFVNNLAMINGEDYALDRNLAPTRPNAFDEYGGPITFSRSSASSASVGSITDSTGKVTYATNNLLLYSEQFDNAVWSKFQLNTTGTPAYINVAVAPDGTLTADKLIISSGNTVGSVSQTYAVTTSSIGSVYAKAGEYSSLSVDFTTSGAQATFNLTTGVVTSTPTGWLAGMISVGNGWYRCWAVPNIIPTRYRIYANAPTTGDGSSGVYVWGAQLEQVTYQTTPRAYIPTTTAAYYGPRFDYDPVTLTPKGLLLEQTSTNLLIYSEDFTVWSVSSVIATGKTTSPSGTNTADIMTASSTSGFFYKNATFTGDGDKVFSIFIKAGTSTQSRMTLRDTTLSTNKGDFTVTWSAGVPSVAATIGSVQGTDTYPNGWYRVRLLATGVVAANGNQFRFLPDSSSGTGNSIYWGVQTENGSFSTSYIPTISSTITRNADACYMTGVNFINWYNQNEGTFVVKYDVLGWVQSQRIFSANDGSNSNDFSEYSSTGSNRMLVTSNGVIMASPIGLNSITAGVLYTAALAASTDNFAISVNGNAAVTDTSGSMPIGINKLNIGSNYTNVGGTLNGHIRSLQYYPERLPNATLQSFTS